MSEGGDGDGPEVLRVEPVVRTDKLPRWSALAAGAQSIGFPLVVLVCLGPVIAELGEQMVFEKPLSVGLVTIAYGFYALCGALIVASLQYLKTDYVEFSAILLVGVGELHFAAGNSLVGASVHPGEWVVVLAIGALAVCMSIRVLFRLNVRPIP